MRHMISFCCIIALTLFSYVSFALPVVSIDALKIKPGKNHSTFIFTMSGKTSGRVKFMFDPNRVVLEFQQTENHFKIDHLNLGGANVTALSNERGDFGSIKFIFYVRDKVTWTTKYLPHQSNSHAVEFQLDIIDEVPSSKPIPQPVSPPQKPLSKTFEQEIPKLAELLAPKESEDPVQAIIPVTNKKSHYTVVIDAGHGGTDPGAKGKKGYFEKNIVLAIAKKLAQEINRDVHMHALLTRNGDYFVPLRTRLGLARKGQADLFIALHADAYFDNNATGVSIYALSEHSATSEAARWLANKDNYPELGGVTFAALKDHSRELRSVLIDLAQTQTIRDSLHLGNSILETIDNISTLHYKNVEQAPFVVLKSPDIPSILIETGFITNPYEERRLADRRYQTKVAHAIYLGLKKYFAKYG